MAKARSILAILIVALLVIAAVEGRSRRRTNKVQQQATGNDKNGKEEGTNDSVAKPEEANEEDKPTETEKPEDKADTDKSGEGTKTDGESKTSSYPSRLVRRRTYRNTAENPRLTHVMAGLGLASLLLVLFA